MENNNRGIAAIIIERDYKGIYERFALTPEEFRQEYPEVFEDKPDDYTVSDPDSCTIAPLVHIWYRECYVGDRMWSKFFTDMTWGLPSIDTDAGNIAYIRRDMMKSLLEYLPDTGESGLVKYKIRISETLSRVIDVDARCATEAIDIAMRRYQTTELVLDTTDMYEVNFENVEDNEK